MNGDTKREFDVKIHFDGTLNCMAKTKWQLQQNNH